MNTSKAGRAPPTGARQLRNIPPPSAASPRLADFIEWDVRNWSRALDFWSRHSAQDLSRCSALEIGCKNGGLSLWMASHGATVVCSDIAGPTEQAVRSHRAHGVAHLITYEPINATHIPYTERFDVVLFKSILGAVARLGDKDAQAKAIAEMHRALKRGGELLFAENLIASPLHAFLRRRYVRWPWRYVSISEMLEFLAPFSHVSWTAVGFTGAFGRGNVQRNILGALDRLLLDRITPERWKYIIIGVARK